MSKRVRKYKGKVGHYKGDALTGRFWVNPGIPHLFVSSLFTSTSTDGALYVYDKDLNQLNINNWPYYHGNELANVAVTSDNVYVCGQIGTGTVTLRKLTNDGTQIWARNHTTLLRAISVDTDGSVYVSGNHASSAPVGGMRKYDSSGTLLYTRNFSSLDFYGIVFDATYFYVVDEDGKIYKANKDGSTGLTSLGNPLSRIATSIKIDKSSNLLVSSWRDVTYPNTIKKFNSSGTLLWQRDNTGQMEDCFVDNFDNIYTAGYAGSPRVGEIRKYNSSGSLLWTANLVTDNSAYLFGITVDSENVYVVGLLRNSDTKRGIAKLDLDGNIISIIATPHYVTKCVTK
jgi:hypothetical protein